MFEFRSNKEALDWLKEYPGERIFSEDCTCFSFDNGTINSDDYDTFSEDEFLKLKTTFSVTTVHGLVGLPNGTIKYDFERYSDHCDAIIGQWCSFSKRTREEMERLVGIAYSSYVGTPIFSGLVDMFLEDAESELQKKDKTCVCKRLEQQAKDDCGYAEEKSDDMLFSCSQSLIATGKLDYYLTAVFSDGQVSQKLKFCPLCGRKLY